MSPPTNFSALIGMFVQLIQAVLPVIMGMAILAFFWGLIKFIARTEGDEKAVGEGKKLMIWGVIALFIMISIWGILRFLSDNFGFGQNIGLPLLPQ